MIRDTNRVEPAEMNMMISMSCVSVQDRGKIAPYIQHRDDYSALVIFWFLISVVMCKD